jgi:hypothetical protein
MGDPLLALGISERVARIRAARSTAAMTRRSRSGQWPGVTICHRAELRSWPRIYVLIWGGDGLVAMSEPGNWRRSWQAVLS